MDIITGCFKNADKLPAGYRRVVISRVIPKGFDFTEHVHYSALSPKPELYDKSVSIAERHKAFRLELDKLNAHEVVANMRSLSGKKGVALLCTEASGKPCHRAVLADWLRENGYACHEWHPAPEPPKSPETDQLNLF